ncbi:hypothetical protein [Kaistella sp.]|uniref:hypothetical protein n=1 Tax=Kaistella sp. TaxID=2782235 RepID=UPI003C48872F
MKKTFFIFFAFISIFLLAQTPPPSVAIPKGNQEKLIDEFLEVSNYKKSLQEYSFTFLYSKMNKKINGKYVKVLDKNDLNLIVENFDYEKFKKQTLYNSFSIISEDKLKEMILFYKKIGGNLTERNELFFISTAINNNLTSLINQAAEEIITKKGF